MNKLSVVCFLSGNEVAVARLANTMQYMVSAVIHMVYVSGSKLCSTKFHWFDK